MTWLYKMSVDNVILPYCIYHSVDPDTRTCLAYLSPPAKAIDKQGNHVFQCNPTPGIITKWTHHGTFYGIRPTLRPIPVGMALFCANKANYFPYDTTETDIVSDPYSLSAECVYFITYTQPTPGTVPLYLHQQGDHSFPSFEKEPPYASEQAWTMGGGHRLPICYVMTEQTVGKLVPFPVPPGGKGANIRFTCLNGRCVPSNAIPSDAFNNTEGEDMDIETCLVKCNMLVEAVNNEDTSLSVLDAVEATVDHNAILPRVRKGLTNSNVALLGAVMGTFVLGLFFVGWLLWSRRKNGNEKSKRKAHYW